MRKILLSLFIVLSMAVTLNAQIETVWERTLNDGNIGSWMSTSSTTRGFAYGHVDGNDRIYVVSREGGLQVVILDAATGDSVGTLSTNGITGGTFPLNDIEVTDDGVIIGCNLAINANFKLYKWADESSDPELLTEVTNTDKRFGDKLDIKGSMDDFSIRIQFTDPTSDSFYSVWSLDQGASWSLGSGGQSQKPALGSSPSVTRSPAGEWYYSANGTAFYKHGEAVPGSVVASGSNRVKYITKIGADDFAAIFQYGETNENAAVVKFPGGVAADAELFGTTNSLYANANGNGVGDVDVKDNGDGTFTIYVLSTNNGVGAYAFDPTFTPVPEVTIAEIQTTVDGEEGDSPYVGQVVTTTGIVTGVRASNGDCFIQDGEGEWNGIWIHAPGTVAVGDELKVTGEIVEYFTLTEFDTPEVEIHSSGNALPNPVVVSTLDANHEKYEGVLVRIENAICDTTELTHDFGEYTLNDGSGDVRVDDLLFPDLSLDSLGAYHITGPVTYSFGFAKVEPRGPEDIEDATVNPDPIELTGWFEVKAGDISFLQDDHLTRGMSINPVNDHLYVASRTGTHAVHVMNAGTGDSLTTLDMRNVAGGVYHLNMVSAADDGVIYATNLALASNALKVYRWASEADTATLAFEAVLNARAGDSFVAVGEGVNTVLYASGSGTDKVFVLTTTDGLTFEVAYEIPVAAGLARGGMSPVSAEPGADVWVNGAGTAASLIDTSGNVVYEFPTDVMGASYHNIDYIEIDGKAGKYVAVAGGNSDPASLAAEVWDVTDLGNVYKYAFGELTGPLTPNSNGTGIAQLSEVNGEVVLHQLLTNNGIAGYGESEYVEPVPPADSLHTYWAQTQANGNFPSYMSTGNYERGMTYVNLDGKDILAVVSRTGGPHVVLHNALNGQVIGELAAPAPPVGLFPLNVAGSSEDGILYVANMTLGANDTNPFTVYAWSSMDAEPQVVVSETVAGGRMGDKFSVYGRADDNSLVMYAGLSTADQVIKYTTTDNGASFTSETITLVGASVGSNPVAAHVPDGTFYFKSYNKPCVHYNADGSVIDTIAGDVIGSAVTYIKTIVNPDNQEVFILAYEPDEDGSGDAEKAFIVDVNKGDKKAFVAAYSPSIGDVANGNGGGAVDFMGVDEETIVVFIMGTNNGIAAFTNDSDLTPPPFIYTPVNVAGMSEGADVKVTWNGGGADESALINLNTGVAASGFFQKPAKAYGSIFDLSALSNPVLKHVEFAHGGFDFFSEEGKYVIHIYDMDAQTTLFTSDTMTTMVPFSGVMWESVSLEDVSGVATLGVFVEAFAQDSGGDVWPTVFTDDVFPSVAGGQIIINDVADPFNNLQEPGNSALGSFLIDLFVTFDGGDKFFKPGVGTTGLATTKADEAKGRKLESFNASNDGIESLITAYNVYRGTDLNSMQLLTTVEKTVNEYLDEAVTGGTYIYGVTAVFTDVESGMSTVEVVHTPVGVEDEPGVPKDFQISQNYPNPFNPTTSIKYALPMAATVKLTVVNILGERVAELVNNVKDAGYYQVNFNASNIASGIYFYTIEAKAIDGAKEFRQVKKMILLK